MSTANLFEYLGRVIYTGQMQFFIYLIIVLLLFAGGGEEVCVDNADMRGCGRYIMHLYMTTCIFSLFH